MAKGIRIDQDGNRQEVDLSGDNMVKVLSLNVDGNLQEIDVGGDGGGAFPIAIPPKGIQQNMLEATPIVTSPEPDPQLSPGVHDAVAVPASPDPNAFAYGPNGSSGGAFRSDGDAAVIAVRRYAELQGGQTYRFTLEDRIMEPDARVILGSGLITPSTTTSQMWEVTLDAPANILFDQQYIVGIDAMGGTLTGFLDNGITNPGEGLGYIEDVSDSDNNEEWESSSRQSPTGIVVS